MNPVLEEILTTGNTHSIDGSLRKVIAQITEEEGNLIQRAIKELNAEVSIEVGLAFGTSALYICEALFKSSRTKHYVIDPFQMHPDSYGGIGLNNLRKAGFENIVKFIDKPSYQALTLLEMENLKVDFAFIDGWHTFDHALIDFFLIDRMLRVGGIVIVDDSDWPAINRVCAFISNNRAYKIFGTTPQRSNLKNSSYNSKKAFTGVRKVKNYLTKNQQHNNFQFGAIAYMKVANDFRLWDHFVDF